MPLSYRWIDASYKYMKKKQPQVTIIICCILPSDEDRTLSLIEIKAWPTCLHMWTSPRAALWEPLSQWLLFLCCNGSRVTLWGVWQPSTGAAGWKKKTKKTPNTVSQRGWLRKGWHESKSQKSLQNVALTLETKKKLRNGILSIQVRFFLSTIKINQSVKIDLPYILNFIMWFRFWFSLPTGDAVAP